MKIKDIIKSKIPKNLLLELSTFHGAYVHKGDISLWDLLLNYKFIKCPKGDPLLGYARQFQKITDISNITYQDGFYYPYDVFKIREVPSERQELLSITVDFGAVLESSVKNLKDICKIHENSTFYNTEVMILDGIDKLSKRISQTKSNDDQQILVTSFFPRLVNYRPQTFYEALQKILFYNALFWQMGHRHIGLGRLDRILISYYRDDIEAGRLDRNSAKKLICSFVRILHKDYIHKSVALFGDTGQYILLGGVDLDGKNVDNELTELFLEVLSELNYPDPKIILRANNDTKDSIWHKSIDCILTGCGSPLIMNEKLIMDGLVNFGFKKEDVWNVGTSACWEPLIIGKSFDQNNPLPSITILKVFNAAILEARDDASYDAIMEDFKKRASVLIKESIHDINFDISPLFSLFFESCLSKGKDFACGGADYSYHGIQIVSFPNLINSILNFKKYVYELKLVTLSQCKEIIINNYEGAEDIRTLFSTNEIKFGSSNSAVIKLTNELMTFFSEEVGRYQINGHNVKLGFSSPNYIVNKNEVKTSLDGRKDYAPFAVHISPVSANIDISEILDFASQLNYDGNRINGNVVDFILPSSYVKQQDKLISLLRNACDKGIFEIQLNVLDKATLIDAKAHPEKYPNLIVRVWGFSAYFNDLPEEYKDNLIQRAQTYEA